MTLPCHTLIQVPYLFKAFVLFFRNILHDKNGSAIDASIAALLCLGVHSAMSCGIGGGFQMVVYDTYVTFVYGFCRFRLIVLTYIYVDIMLAYL